MILSSSTACTVVALKILFSDVAFAFKAQIPHQYTLQRQAPPKSSTIPKDKKSIMVWGTVLYTGDWQYATVY